MENRWPWNASRGPGPSSYYGLVQEHKGDHSNHLTVQHKMASILPADVALPVLSTVTNSAEFVQPVGLITQSSDHIQSGTHSVVHNAGHVQHVRSSAQSSDQRQSVRSMAQSSQCDQEILASEDELRVMNQMSALYNLDLRHFQEWCSQTKGVTVHLPEAPVPHDEVTEVSGANSNQLLNDATKIHSMPLNDTEAQCDVPKVGCQTSCVEVSLETSTSTGQMYSNLSMCAQSEMISQVDNQVMLAEHTITTNPEPVSDVHNVAVIITPTLSPPCGATESDDCEDEDMPVDVSTDHGLIRSNTKRQSYSVVFKLQVAGFYELVKNQHLTARVFGLPRNCVRRWSRDKHQLVKMFLSGDSNSYKTKKRYRQDTSQAVVAGKGETEPVTISNHVEEMLDQDGLEEQQNTDSDHEQTTDSRVKPEPGTDFHMNGAASGGETEEEMNLSCTNDDEDISATMYEVWEHDKPSTDDCKPPIYHVIKGEQTLDGYTDCTDNYHSDSKDLDGDTQEYNKCSVNSQKKQNNSNIVSLEHKLKVIAHAEAHGLDSTVVAYNITAGTIINWTKSKAEYLQRQQDWEDWKNGLADGYTHSATLEALLLDWFKTSDVLISWDMLQWKSELLASSEASIKEELCGETFRFDREYMEQFTRRNGLELCGEDEAGTLAQSDDDINTPADTHTDSIPTDATLSSITWKNNSDTGRQKKCYPLHFKLQVITHFEKSHNKAATARKYHIDRKQVQSWVQNRDHLFKHIHLGNCARLPGCGRKYMSKTLEDKLLDWMSKTEAGGKHVSHSMLKNQAKLYYKSDPVVRKECLDKGFENFSASEGWVRSFLRRNSVHSDNTRRNVDTTAPP